MPRERKKERKEEGWSVWKKGGMNEKGVGSSRPRRRATTLIYDSPAHSGPRITLVLHAFRRDLCDDITLSARSTRPENTRETKKTWRRRERLSRFRRGGVSRDVVGKLDRLFRMRYSCVNFKQDNILDIYIVNKYGSRISLAGISRGCIKRRVFLFQDRRVWFYDVGENR